MRNTNTSDLARSGIIWLPLSFLATWLACSLYIRPVWLQIGAAAAAAILLTQALLRQQSIRRKAMAREQFKWFLELLLSRLTAGATLERSLCDTIPGLEQMLSTKSPFLKSLRLLDRQLQARQPLDQLLPSLALQIRCPEARYFFRLLPELQRTRSQIIPFARHYLHMVAEQLALQQTIGSDTTQRRTEAIFLAAMPFAMAALIRSGLDLQTVQAMNRTSGVMAWTATCLIALTALILVCRLIVFDPDHLSRSGHLPVNRRKPGRWRGWLAVRLCAFYRAALPAAYGARLLQMLFNLERQQVGAATDLESDITQAYFLRKLDLMLLSLVPAALCCLVLPAGCVLLLLPFVMAMLHDKQLLSRHREQLAEYQVLYPILINLLTALLQAGLSLHRAFQITAACLEAAQDHPPGDAGGLTAELAALQKKIHSGSPVSVVLQDMLTACPLPEAQAALLLLLRYAQAGEEETIQLLTLQASACWSLHRNAARSQLEQQGLKLLLPMTLDLVAVLMTALLPAVFSLQAI